MLIASTYSLLTNSVGNFNGIANNEFHLALHIDKNQDQAITNDNTNDRAVDLYHCGGDDKDQDGAADVEEVLAGTVCAMH